MRYVLYHKTYSEENCGGALMGIYADKKNEAHTWFDKLWRNHEERDYYYHRLSKDMGIEYESCHFSTMSVEQIDQALVLIKKYWFEKYDR